MFPPYAQDGGAIIYELKQAQLCFISLRVRMPLLLEPCFLYLTS